MDGEPRASPRPAPAATAAPPPADADARGSKPDLGAEPTSSKHAERPHDSHTSAPPSPPDARPASALQSRRPEPDAGLRLPPLRSIDIGAATSSSSASHRTLPSALPGSGPLPPFSPRHQGPHGSAPPPLPSPSLSTHSRSELRSPPRLGTAGSARQGPSSSYFPPGPSPAASHRSVAGPSASTVSRWTDEHKRPNLAHSPSDAEVYRQQQPQTQTIRSRTPSSYSDPARGSPPTRPRAVEESKTWPLGTPVDASRSSLDDSRALPTARSMQGEAARSAPSAHQLESTLERLEQVYALAGDLQSFAGAHLKSRQMPSFASMDAMAMRGSDVAAIMSRLASEANEARIRAEAPSHRYAGPPSERSEPLPASSSLRGAPSAWDASSRYQAGEHDELASSGMHAYKDAYRDQHRRDEAGGDARRPRSGDDHRTAAIRSPRPGSHYPSAGVAGLDGVDERVEGFAPVGVRRRADESGSYFPIRPEPPAHAQWTADERDHPYAHPAARQMPTSYSSHAPMTAQQRDYHHQQQLQEQQHQQQLATSKYRKRSRAPAPGQCACCSIAETPEWRRGPDGARTVCNACGLHFAKLAKKRQQENPNGPGVSIEELRASIRVTSPSTTPANIRDGSQNSQGADYGRAPHTSMEGPASTPAAAYAHTHSHARAPSGAEGHPGSQREPTDGRWPEDEHRVRTSEFRGLHQMEQRHDPHPPYGGALHQPMHPSHSQHDSRSHLPSSAARLPPPPIRSHADSDAYAQRPSERRSPRPGSRGSERRP